MPRAGQFSRRQIVKDRRKLLWSGYSSGPGTRAASRQRPDASPNTKPPPDQSPWRPRQTLSDCIPACAITQHKSSKITKISRPHSQNGNPRGSACSHRVSPGNRPAGTRAPKQSCFGNSRRKFPAMTAQRASIAPTLRNVGLWCNGSTAPRQGSRRGFESRQVHSSGSAPGGSFKMRDRADGGTVLSLQSS